jgi:urease accessory protein
MRISSKNALLLIAACAVSTGASAHIGMENHAHAGFMSGFVHPLSGLDHLAAMLAVGVWSALTARRAGADLLWGPLAFSGMLLVGALLGLLGVAIPAVEPMIAASLLVTGLLVSSRLRVPGLLAAALVGVFAVFHGVAHGYELSGQASAVSTLAGMLCATVLLHATGLAIGWALRTSVWVPRVAGTAVAVLGVSLLTQLA